MGMLTSQTIEESSMELGKDFFFFFLVKELGIFSGGHEDSEEGKYGKEFCSVLGSRLLKHSSNGGACENDDTSVNELKRELT